MSVATISTHIDQFFSGAVDPSVPHLVLILAAVIGGFAVGIGIIWEAARSGHLWTLPTAFVFFGVVIEAAATVILFEFDEGISHAQQSKIIALENELAPRSLSPEQRLRIENKIRRFAGQEYALSVAAGSEAANLLIAIDDVLKSAGWVRISGVSSKSILVSTALGEMPLNAYSGVGVRVAPSHLPQYRERVLVLVGALKGEGIVAEAAQDPHIEAHASAIDIMIGIKP